MLIPSSAYLDSHRFTFMVECDASSEGVGAILLQSEHPIAYFSKGFCSPIITSLLMIENSWLWFLPCKKWKHYLLGHHFFVRSDHCSLKYLQQRLITTEQQSLIMKLLTYKSGQENRGADALSRRPQHADLR